MPSQQRTRPEPLAAARRRPRTPNTTPGTTVTMVAPAAPRASAVVAKPLPRSVLPAPALCPPGLPRRGKARPAPGHRAQSGPGHGPERLHPVGPLPGEVRLLPAEVAEGGGLCVDRPEQLEVPHDRGRAQVEDLQDGILDLPHRDLLGTEALHEQ